jgi:hypothetical protein
MELPAGGKVEIEIACKYVVLCSSPFLWCQPDSPHSVAWTSYGARTTDRDSELSACPNNYGAHHSGDPAGPLDDSLLSGCALAIADVDDINDVTMDNLAVFSVNHQCVKQRVTNFEVRFLFFPSLRSEADNFSLQIPARMPTCTGKKCVCGWFWLANNGTANFYMTRSSSLSRRLLFSPSFVSSISNTVNSTLPAAFDCSIIGSPADATPIAPPQDPVFCGDAPSNCTTGSRRPLYAYNQPTNVECASPPLPYSGTRR